MDPKQEVKETRKRKKEQAPKKCAKKTKENANVHFAQVIRARVQLPAFEDWDDVQKTYWARAFRTFSNASTFRDWTHCDTAIDAYERATPLDSPEFRCRSKKTSPIFDMFTELLCASLGASEEVDSTIFAYLGNYKVECSRVLKRKIAACEPLGPIYRKKIGWISELIRKSPHKHAYEREAAMKDFKECIRRTVHVPPISAWGSLTWPGNEKYVMSVFQTFSDEKEFEKWTNETHAGPVWREAEYCPLGPGDYIFRSDKESKFGWILERFRTFFVRPMDDNALGFSAYMYWLGDETRIEEIRRIMKIHREMHYDFDSMLPDDQYERVMHACVARIVYLEDRAALENK